MSAEPEREMTFIRHPLGLPPGSVRAVLALMITGLFWLFLALPDTFPKEERVPLFLYAMLALVLLFIGAHGHTIGHHITGHSPLYLPRGVLRALILLGTTAELVWIYFYHPDRIAERMVPDPNLIGHWPALLLATFGGFGFGYVVRKGPWRKSAGYQDILAWVSMLAMIGLVVETILIVFVKPTMETAISTAAWETILSAIVAFYFGARS